MGVQILTGQQAVTYYHEDLSVQIRSIISNTPFRDWVDIFLYLLEFNSYLPKDNKTDMLHVGKWDILNFTKL